MSNLSYSQISVVVTLAFVTILAMMGMLPTFAQTNLVETHATNELKSGNSNGACEKIGGIWNSTSSTCTLDANLTLNADDSLTIDSGVTLTVNSILDIDDTGTVTNNGIINNNGTMILTSGGYRTDYYGNIVSTLIVTRSGGTIVNTGTILNNGHFTICNKGIISNDGTIINTGKISEKATMTYSGLINPALLNINAGGVITNTGSITNAGIITIDNEGTITNIGIINNANDTVHNGSYFQHLFGVIYNYGYILNTNKGIINNTVMGTINNDNNPRNLIGMNNEGYNVIDNGTIANKGIINNKGYIDNTGVITKFCGSSITGTPIAPRSVINMCNSTPPTPISTMPNSTSTATLPAKIPNWVKSVFSFYGQGKISDDELIGAIQFLVKQGILKIS